MLTGARRIRQRVATGAAGLVTLLALGVVLASPAAACTPPLVQGDFDPVTKTYTCTNPATSTPGTEDPTTPTGPSAPPCDLSAADGLIAEHSAYSPSGPYCRSKDTCILIEHHAPWAVPPGDKPSEDAEMRVRWCALADGGTLGVPVWEGEDTPSLLQQAQEAIGKITLPVPDVSTSPVNRSLVNLDTWYWVAGQPQQATGSSAFGLVAIATFRSLQVDPGDGSAPFTCPLVTNSDDAERDCAYTYRSSSRGGSAEVDGRPAFQVTATATYDLRFEVNGAAVDVNGAPATLSGPVGEQALRVDEVQSTVTGLR